MVRGSINLIMHAEPEVPDGDTTPKWYCLRTQTKREHIAAAIVDQIEGVEVFCPRISQIKKTRVGKKRFTEALFPSYLFTRFSYREHFRRIVHTQGIRGIVKLGNRRAIPNEVIQELIATLPSNVVELADPSIQPGAKIEFVSGSLKGLNGIVLASLSSSERVNILLEFLGREIQVQADSGDIMLAQDQ